MTEHTKAGIDTAVREAAKWASKISDSPEYAQGVIDALRCVQNYQYGWFQIQETAEMSWMEEFK